MRKYPLHAGLAGLLALAGCAMQPPAQVAPVPEAPAPTAPAANEPASVAAAQPLEAPSAEPSATPSAPAASAVPESPAPTATPTITPAPPVYVPPPSSSGGGGGGGDVAPPPPPPTPTPAPSADAPMGAVTRAFIAEVSVDSEQAGAPKANLTDGDAATRWSSRTGWGAWAQLKLGASKPLYALNIRLPAFIKFDVQTSADGKAWVPQLTGQSAPNDKPLSLAFPANVSGQYVRVVCRGGTSAAKPFQIQELQLFAGSGGDPDLPPPPPWARPVNPITEANIHTAGLGFMKGDHTNSPLHVHAYMFVWYNGKPVQIPANVGIASGRTAYMHTHDTTGTIHMEGPAGMRFTLGQFFTLWGVPLKGVKVYDHGVRQWNPEQVQLTNKRLLKVVFGTPPVGEGIPLD